MHAVSARTEQSYVTTLRRQWPRQGEVTHALLVLADEAVAHFPQSAKLWCLRAALIQLGSGEVPYTLDEALESYKHALSADPKSVEVLEDIAHFYDAVMGDASTAAVYFKKAKEARSNVGT